MSLSKLGTGMYSKVSYGVEFMKINYSESFLWESFKADGYLRFLENELMTFLISDSYLKVDRYRFSRMVAHATVVYTQVNTSKIVSTEESYIGFQKFLATSLSRFGPTQLFLMRLLETKDMPPDIVNKYSPFSKIHCRIGS